MFKEYIPFSLLLCACIAGCSQAKKRGEAGTASESFACPQNFVEPASMRNVMADPEIERFSPLIVFRSAKSDIHEDARPILDSISTFLGMTHHRYLVVVYSDKIGPKKEVFALSGNRAESIVKYLIEKGISGERLRPMGVGWRCYIGEESSKEDQMKNRRIEFVRI